MEYNISSVLLNAEFQPAKQISKRTSELNCEIYSDELIIYKKA